MCVLCGLAFYLQPHSCLNSSAQVMVEKHRIQTMSKFENLKSTVQPEVMKTVSESIDLLCSDKVLTEGTTEILEGDVTLDQQALAGSPAETLKLRCLIAVKLFDSRFGSAGSESVIKLVDADPYLSSLQDFKKSGAVETIEGVQKQRDDWLRTVKTARILVWCICAI